MGWQLEYLPVNTFNHWDELKNREYICENPSCEFVVPRDYNSCRNLIQRIPR